MNASGKIQTELNRRKIHSIPRPWTYLRSNNDFDHWMRKNHARLTLLAHKQLTSTQAPAQHQTISNESSIPPSNTLHSKAFPFATGKRQSRYYAYDIPIIILAKRANNTQNRICFYLFGKFDFLVCQIYTDGKYSTTTMFAWGGFLIPVFLFFFWRLFFSFLFVPFVCCCIICQSAFTLMRMSVMWKTLREWDEQKVNRLKEAHRTTGKTNEMVMKKEKKSENDDWKPTTKNDSKKWRMKWGK